MITAPSTLEGCACTFAETRHKRHIMLFNRLMRQPELNTCVDVHMAVRRAREGFCQSHFHARSIQANLKPWERQHVKYVVQLVSDLFHDAANHAACFLLNSLLDQPVQIRAKNTVDETGNWAVPLDVHRLKGKGRPQVHGNPAPHVLANSNV
jgi:hypothetical protein